VNAIVRKMRARFKNGSPVALMCYAGGAFFFVDRYGVVVAPRGTAGLNREQSQAAIDNGELTECSTPLAHELRGRGVGTGGATQEERAEILRTIFESVSVDIDTRQIVRVLPRNEYAALVGGAAYFNQKRKRRDSLWLSVKP